MTKKTSSGAVAVHQSDMQPQAGGTPSPGVDVAPASSATASAGSLAPAVIDDVLPGGPRWMHNLAHDPIWVETKTQLKHELESRGLVIDERTHSAKSDATPWATRDRLKPGAHDPFIHPAGPQPDGTTPSALPSSTGSPDQMPGTVDDRPVEAFQLSLDQMRLIREYARYITDAGLESWLYCGRCISEALPSEISRCQVDVRLDTVFIVCDCALRYGNGATALSTRLPVVDLGPKIIEMEYARTVELSAPVLRLFWQYRQQILVPLGLKEALRCSSCYDAHRQDGTCTRCTATSLSIECRCLKRTFTGR